MRAIETVDAALREDGDPLRIMATRDDGPSGVVAAPRGRRQARAFLALYQPVLVLWIGGRLDHNVLAECQKHGVQCVVLNGSAAMFSERRLGWVPYRSRVSMKLLRQVFTLDAAATEAALRAGVDASRIVEAGRMTEIAQILNHSEDDRTDIAQAIATRPTWLAVNAEPADLDCLISAQKEAMRRSHSLLLIVAPKVVADIDMLKDGFAKAGMRVAVRDTQYLPKPDTEVFIADNAEELGLWHRVSPISFLCGTFDDRANADPFAAAALGSAVVHGPNGGEWQAHLQRLVDAGASVPVAQQAQLAPALVGLLSADRTAQVVHKGWEVTTRGAMVMEQVLELVRGTLEPDGAQT